MSEHANESSRVYRTLEEAQQHPQHGKLKDGSEKAWDIYRVISPSGEEYFTWAGGGSSALRIVTLDCGWSSGIASSKRGKVDIKAALAAMSEEDRKALLADYLPAKKTRKTE